MTYPACPNETPDACRFRTSDLRATCLGWTQIYNRKGEPLTEDPNTTTGRLHCDGCGAVWSLKQQGRKPTEYVLNVAARLGEP